MLSRLCVHLQTRHKAHRKKGQGKKIKRLALEKVNDP